MADSTPAPSPVSLSQAHAPRWFMRDDNLWASRNICQKNLLWTKNQWFVLRVPPFVRLSTTCTYLVAAFAIDCHNETNAACFMFICWIVQTLCGRSFPFLLFSQSVLLSVLNYAFSFRRWRLEIVGILVRWWRHLQLWATFNSDWHTRLFSSAFLVSNSRFSFKHTTHTHTQLQCSVLFCIEYSFVLKHLLKSIFVSIRLSSSLKYWLAFEYIYGRQFACSHVSWINFRLRNAMNWQDESANKEIEYVVLGCWLSEKRNFH